VTENFFDRFSLTIARGLTSSRPRQRSTPSEGASTGAQRPVGVSRRPCLSTRTPLIYWCADSGDGWLRPLRQSARPPVTGGLAGGDRLVWPASALQGLVGSGAAGSGSVRR
jgi:hypothetical protein